MGDDGNRQVALTVEQVAVSVGLNAEQFAMLDTQLSGINGAINKLAENVSDPETNIAAQVTILTGEVQSLKEVVAIGAADLRQSITDLNNSLFTALTELSSNTGKWLAAIALAAANPEDNTAEVQQQIDAATASVKAVKDKLQTSVDSQTKGD